MQSDTKTIRQSARDIMTIIIRKIPDVIQVFNMDNLSRTIKASEAGHIGVSWAKQHRVQAHSLALRIIPIHFCSGLRK